MSGSPGEGFHLKIPIHFLLTTQKVTRRYISIVGYITEIISSSSPVNRVMNFLFGASTGFGAEPRSQTLLHLSPTSLQELVLGTKKANLGLWLPTRGFSKPLQCCSHPQEIKI